MAQVPPSFKLSMPHREIDLTRVNAVWYRRPKKPVPETKLDAKAKLFVAQECATVFDDVVGNLPCRWLPARPSVCRQAEGKVRQLVLAAALGFEIPATLVTNQPASLLTFQRRATTKIVSKLAGTSFAATLGSHMLRYTEGVSTRDLANVAALRLCPMIFRAHELPAEVSNRCAELVRRLNLSYGAIDLIATPDGKYVFLEINPNGQYLWIEEIEEATDLPISDAICEYLEGRV